MIKLLVAVLLTASSTVVPLARATTAQTVTVMLQDHGVDRSHSDMAIKTDTATVKSGSVTLQAVNQSKHQVHEVVIVPAPSPGTDLPYDAKSDTVDEKRVRSLGEISDLKPGAHGKLTLNLKPGTYLLLCNQPGHYKSGMSTRLVVVRSDKATRAASG